MSTPYDTYKNTKEWLLIEKIIEELVDNQDIQLLTSQDYIVGFIAKQLAENNQQNKV